jgi:hypothetical protein
MSELESGSARRTSKQIRTSRGKGGGGDTDRINCVISKFFFFFFFNIFNIKFINIIYKLLNCGTSRVCVRGRFVRQHSWLEMSEKRPPIEREDGGSQGAGEGIYQGEGGGARERGRSPARGPQEAGETQEGGQATGKRAGDYRDSSGGRSAPGGRESDSRDEEGTSEEIFNYNIKYKFIN